MLFLLIVLIKAVFQTAMQMPDKINSIEVTELSVNVSVAFVFNSVGLKLASFNTKASFILKQPASAEAMSSSGLVPSSPLSFSNKI